LAAWFAYKHRSTGPIVSDCSCGWGEVIWKINYEDYTATGEACQELITEVAFYFVLISLYYIKLISMLGENRLANEGGEGTMKGIYLTGPNNFSLQELPDPVPGKNDVLIQVRMAGICGSDVHLLRGRNPFAAYPLVPGHEYMGEVLQAPRGRGFRKEEKVTVFPEVGCGKCPACKEGRLVHCPEFKFVGVRVPGGCFCEKLAVPYQRVIKLPKTMTDEEGAMVEPTAVAVHAVQRGGVKRGDRVLVVGGGTIGLLTAQAARVFGASKVVISEPIAARRKIAQALGFKFICNPLADDLVAYVKDEVGSMDVVFDVVGLKKTLEDSQAVLRPDGTLVLVALPHNEGLGVPYQPIFAKELRVIGSRTYFMKDFPFAIRLMQAKKIRVKPIISAVIPMTNFHEGLQNLEKEPEKYVKVLVRPAA
jgi:L-iditol 2-dehydrogenase/L-gulonate 5-dehydrogenase